MELHERATSESTQLRPVIHCASSRVQAAKHRAPGFAGEVLRLVANIVRMSTSTGGVQLVQHLLMVMS